MRTEHGAAALQELLALPTLEAVQLEHVRRVMEQCDGQVTLAARVLGIGRATLYRWIRGLELETSGERAIRRRNEQAKRAEQIWREFACRGPKL